MARSLTKVRDCLEQTCPPLAVVAAAVVSAAWSRLHTGCTAAAFGRADLPLALHRLFAPQVQAKCGGLLPEAFACRPAGVCLSAVLSHLCHVRCCIHPCACWLPCCPGSPPAVSRIKARSDLYEMDLTLDINVDVFPGAQPCWLRCGSSQSAGPSISLPSPAAYLAHERVATVG